MSSGFLLIVRKGAFQFIKSLFNVIYINSDRFYFFLLFAIRKLSRTTLNIINKIDLGGNSRLWKYFVDDVC